MEREANYLAVGSFVLLVLAMGILFIYWYSSTYHRANYTRYEIYFDESVSGLTVGSPVRYLGVDVGQVQSLRIDPHSPSLVQVVVDVAPTTPVSPQTVAQLSLQGITGLLYVDLQRTGPQRTAALTRAPSQQYPVIASEPSSLGVLLNDLPALTSRLEGLLDRGSRLLSDSNIEAFDHIAGNLDQASAAITPAVQNAAALVQELRATVRQTNAILADLQTLSAAARVDMVGTLQRLHAMSENLDRTSARLDALVLQNGPRLSGLMQDAVPQLEGLLRDSRATMRQLDELARSLNQNPSQLIYQPRTRGVSIPP